MSNYRTLDGFSTKLKNNRFDSDHGFYTLIKTNSIENSIELNRVDSNRNNLEFNVMNLLKIFVLSIY
jgi:hypothetical protein